jgi:hypothetical protein
MAKGPYRAVDARWCLDRWLATGNGKVEFDG